MIPRHEYDRNYMAIPDAPQGSMVRVADLPPAVFEALCVVREYEGEGAYRPALLSDGVRAWFRWEDRRP